MTITPSARDRPSVEQKSAAFVEKIARTDPQRLVFLHESGSHISMTRDYAWAPIGVRAHGRVPRNRGRVLTMRARARARRHLRADDRRGGTTRDVLLRFLREHLLPTLRSGDVVVMDNLGAHHATGVRELLATVGARPLYSPDLNPIELCWSKLKNALRGVGARTMRTLANAVQVAADEITANDATGWFKHCGCPTQPARSALSA